MLHLNTDPHSALESNWPQLHPMDAIVDERWAASWIDGVEAPAHLFQGRLVSHPAVIRLHLLRHQFMPMTSGRLPLRCCGAPVAVS